MAIPEAVENEFRMKGSQKSDRERTLQKRVDVLKDQLNAQVDKVNGLKDTFKRKMASMKEVNDKLQSDMQEVVGKHDDRLIKYLELSDQFDELEAKYNELRGIELPEETEVQDENGGETGATEVLEEE